jgi:thioredoxin 1
LAAGLIRQSAVHTVLARSFRSVHGRSCLSMSTTFLAAVQDRADDTEKHSDTVGTVELERMLAELELDNYRDAFFALAIGDEQLGAAREGGENAVNALIRLVGVRGGSATKMRRRLLLNSTADGEVSEGTRRAHHRQRGRRKSKPDVVELPEASREVKQVSGHFTLTSQLDLSWVFEQSQTSMISSGIVVVMFTASWCSACKKFAPTYNRMVRELESTYLCIADADEASEFSAAHSVTSLPHFVIFRNGRKWDVLIGGKATILRQKVLKAIDGKVHHL